MIFNYRQLAEGLTTIDGRRLRPNLLVHSAYMEPIPEHRDFLEDAGIETVFDFRTSLEIKHKPNFATITVNYYPIAQDASEALLDSNRDVRLLLAFYDHGFEQCQYLKSAIRDIVLYPRRILYHSSLGKDRTGIVSIILMSILGYSLEDINKHYLAVDDLYIEEARSELKRLHPSMSEHEVEDLITVKQEYFDLFYNALIERYGCLENYIDQVFHFEPSQIERFKDYCLH